MLVNTKPQVIHECENCQATITPEESGQSVNVSGLIQCRKCGHTGPLRIRGSGG